MTTLFRAPWILIATALMLAFAPQGREGQKALVYCPVDVDAAGCSTIVKALTDGGEFAGGVDRGYTGSDGTVDLKSVDLAAYSVLVVPSLADDANEHPYDMLRDRDVATRIRGALRGRQVFFSGTPDQGASIETRAQKDALIRNLARWAAAKYASAKGPGIVVLQDQSEDVEARYAWARDLVGYRVAARTGPSTYSRVQTSTPAGREILASGSSLLSYGNMASFGLSLPDGGATLSSDAFGQGADKDLIMVTGEAATFASTAADLRFAFLSPLGTGTADPSSFDASATPVVEICAWANNACSGAPIARFTMAPTGTNLPLVANTSAGRFEASWNLLNASFTTRKTYRIQVLKGNDQLGFVFIDVTRGRWALTRTDGTLAPLVSANTLPIMFTMSSVTTVNQPPVASITAPLTGASFAAGATINFLGTGTDAEDGNLTAGALVWTSNVAGPIGTGASINVSTLAVGAHTITLTATDSRGAAHSASITINVVANQAPHASITAPANGAIVDVGQPITFTGTGTDTEDGNLADASLVWTSDKAGRIGTGATFSTSGLAAGKHVITLTATDSKSLTGTATVDVIVNALPVATITAPPTNASFPDGQAIAFAGTGTDAEDGNVGASLVWTSSIGGQIGTGPTISVNNLAVGTHAITLTAKDSHNATHSATITITIAANRPPVASITSPAPGAIVDEHQPVTFTGTGTDPEDGNLTDASLVWVSDKAGQIGTGNTFNVNGLVAGKHVITLTVKDSRGATHAATVDLIVNALPVATIVSPATNASFPEGQAVVFTGTGTDAEDGTVGTSLVWFSSLGGQIGTGPTISVNTLAVGTHVITLNAKDSHNATHSASITILILANQPPRATITSPTGPTTINEGASITFTGEASDPEDGALTGASLVWTSDKAGQIGIGASFAVKLAAGTHVVTLTAKDSRGLTHAAQVTVVVNALPVAAISAPATNSSFPFGATINFVGTGTDAEDGTLGGSSLAWSSDIGGALGTGALISVNTLVTGTHVITLTATDSRGATHAVSITVLVAANQRPNAAISAPAPNAVVAVGQPIQFTGAANDPEDGPLTGVSLAWSSSISGSIGSGGSVSATLPVGDHTITLTATDSKGLAGTATVHVIVNAPPTATISAPLDNASFADGTTIPFTGAGSDREDGTLTGASLVWTSDAAGQIGTGESFSVNNLHAGTHHITLTATDSHGAKGVASITINIFQNRPPVAAITAPASGTVVNVGDAVTFTGTGTDPEDQTLTGASLKWTSNLDGAIGQGATFTKSDLSRGTHVITLTVTDSKGLTAIAATTLVVNGRPAASIVSPADGSSFPEGRAITFTGDGTDPENEPLTSFTWTDNNNPLGSGRNVTTSNLPPGSHSIVLTVTDSHGATATAHITLTVTPNRPPTATITSPAANSVVNPGQAVTFEANGSDPDEELPASAFVWTSSLSGQIGTGPSFTKSDLPVGRHAITLTVTDSRGVAVTATTTLFVNAAPTNARITQPADGANITVGDPITFQGTATDPESEALTYAWSSNVGGALGTGASLTVSNLALGAHTITLTVSDPHSLSATASITITIVANHAPTATIAKPVSGSVVRVGESVLFDGSGDDAEDHALSGNSLVWTSNLVTGELGRGATFSLATLPAGTHTITLTATDSKGATGTATTTLVVNAPPTNVKITQPADGASIPFGQSVTFQGSADDANGDPLTYAWSSDVAGALGNGASLTVSNLAVGAHHITLTVTDSHSATATAAINITIAPNQPPVPQITKPQNGQSFLAGTPIVFEGTATDPEETLPPTALVWKSNLQGDLGTGTQFTRSDLLPGSHHITLTATDRNNAVASTSVDIVVLHTTLTVPAGVTVPINTTVLLNVSLRDPAPAGGLVVTVTSDQPGIAQVVTPTVTIAAGASSADAQIKGIALGEATIHLSAPGYTATTSRATVAPSTRTWVGGSSLGPTRWDIAANWQPQIIPSQFDNVIIPSSAAFDPVLQFSNANTAGLDIGSGRSLNVNAFSLTVSGAATIGGTLAGFGGIAAISGNVTAGIGSAISVSTFRVGGALSAAGAFTPTTTIFTGANQTIPAGPNYQYRDLEVQGTARFGGPVTMTGALRISGTGAILNVGSSTSTVAGGFTVQSGGRLQLTDPAAVLAVAGPISLNSSAQQTGDLTAGQLRVAGNITIGNANTFPATGGTVVFTGSGTQTLNNFVSQTVGNQFYNMEVSGTSTVTVNAPFVVAGSLDVRSGALAGPSELIVAGGVNTAAGTSVTPSALHVGGALTASGTFSPATTYFIGANQIIPGGSNYQYKDIEVRGTARFGGAATLTGAVRINGSTAILNAGAVTTTAAGGLTVLSGGRLQLTDPAGVLAVGGAVSLQSAGQQTGDLTAGQLRVGGNFSISNQNAFPATGGTVVFTGNGTQTVSNPAAFQGTKFHHVEVAGTGGGIVNFTTPFTGGGNLAVTSGTLGGSGALLMAGDVSTAGGSTVTITQLGIGGALSGTGIFSPGTAFFTGSNQVIPGGANFQYKDIEVNGTARVGSAATLSGAVRINGSTAILNAGAVTTTAAGGLTVLSGGRLQLTDPAGVLAVGGAVSLQSAGQQTGDLTAGQLRVGGNFSISNQNAFPATGGTVVFTGNGTQTVSNPAAFQGTKFHHVEVAGTGGGIVNFTTPFTGGGNLTMTSGTLGGGGALFMAGSGTTAVGSTVTITQLGIGGALSGTGVFSPGTAYFTGSNQVIPGGANFQYKDIEVNGTASFGSPATLSGAVRINGSTAILNAGAVTTTAAGGLTVLSGGRLQLTDPAGVLAVGGAVSLQSAAQQTGDLTAGQLRVGGNFSISNQNAFPATGGTVVFTGNGTQTVSNPAAFQGTKFHHVEVAGTGGGIVNFTTPFTGGGNLTMTSGTLGGGGALFMAGSGTTAVGSTVTITQLGIGGALSGTGVFSPGTAYFTGSNQVIPGGANFQYKDIEVNGTASFGSPATLTGAVRINGSTAILNAGAVTTTAAGGLTVLSGGRLQLTDPAGVLAVGGAVSLQSAAQQTGDLTAGQLRVGGNFSISNQNAFPATGGTVVFTGSGAQTVSNPAGFQGSKFFNMQILNGTTVNLSSPFTAAGLLDIGGVLNNSSSSQAGDIILRSAATLNNTGTLRYVNTFTNQGGTVTGNAPVKVIQ